MKLNIRLMIIIKRIHLSLIITILIAKYKLLTSAILTNKIHFQLITLKINKIR